ncbi:MAG: hypothetical protein ABI723_26035 [Bacteroidia bacterium]
MAVSLQQCKRLNRSKGISANNHNSIMKSYGLCYIAQQKKIGWRVFSRHKSGSSTKALEDLRQWVIEKIKEAVQELELSKK